MSSVEFDSVLAEIRDRVAARRARGEYPIGLEAQLEAEFDAVLKGVHREEVDTRALRERMASVARSIAGLGAEPELGSRVPGGSAVHATAGRVVRRHVGPLTDSVRAVSISIEDALREVVRVLDAQRSADERQLVEVVGSLFDRLAVLDSLVSAVADLERRVGEVERASTSP